MVQVNRHAKHFITTTYMHRTIVVTVCMIDGQWAKAGKDTRYTTRHKVGILVIIPQLAQTYTNTANTQICTG